MGGGEEGGGRVRGGGVERADMVQVLTTGYSLPWNLRMVLSGADGFPGSVTVHVQPDALQPDRHSHTQVIY